MAEHSPLKPCPRPLPEAAEHAVYLLSIAINNLTGEARNRLPATFSLIEHARDELESAIAAAVPGA
jgi:hypothetical protein